MRGEEGFDVAELEWAQLDTGFSGLVDAISLTSKGPVTRPFDAMCGRP